MELIFSRSHPKKDDYYKVFAINLFFMQRERERERVPMINLFYLLIKERFEGTTLGCAHEGTFIMTID